MAHQHSRLRARTADLAAAADGVEDQQETVRRARGLVADVDDAAAGHLTGSATAAAVAEAARAWHVALDAESTLLHDLAQALARASADYARADRVLSEAVIRAMSGRQ